MEFHPISNIFPLMAENELPSLADDIAKNGLIEPIVTHEDMILDGRNRYLACQKVNVELDYVPLDKDRDPLDFVISVNLKHRYLNESQRAMVAAKLANMPQGFRTDLEPSANLPKVSQPQSPISGAGGRLNE